MLLVRWLAPLVALVGALALTDARAQTQSDVGERVIVFVGGLESSLDLPHWSGLRAALAGRGVADTDVRVFSYAGAGSQYAGWDTCQDVETSSERLADMLRGLRARGAREAVLVGHSLGGVLATDTVLRASELTPFVRSVIAVDSPFSGITPLASLWFDQRCTAAWQLMDRRREYERWQAWYAERLPPLMERGLTVRAIVNRADGLVGPAAQCICGLPVNWDVMVDGVDAHTAVFYDPALVEQIAELIR